LRLRRCCRRRRRSRRGRRPAGELDLSSAPRGPASSPGGIACYWSGRGRPAGARDQLRRASPGPTSESSSDALRRASPGPVVRLCRK
jgi:hypothetical protein